MPTGIRHKTSVKWDIKEHTHTHTHSHSLIA